MEEKRKMGNLSCTFINRNPLTFTHTQLLTHSRESRPAISLDPKLTMDLPNYCFIVLLMILCSWSGPAYSAVKPQVDFFFFFKVLELPQVMLEEWDTQSLPWLQRKLIQLLCLCFFVVVCFFAFCGHTLGIWKSPGEGSNESYSCQPTPQPSQHQIRAVSVTHTTAHGNAGSLTH